MSANSFDLAWIVVEDIKKAVDFYTNVIGLKLIEFHEGYGWAELSGKKGGARLGIAQKQPEGAEDTGCGSSRPGQNAVMTFTVDNIEEAVKALVAKGAQILGSIVEVPGHVKMQTIADTDGNQMQLVEKLQVNQHHGCCSGH